MIQPHVENRVHRKDEQYTKVFIVCGAGESLRKCLICEKLFSRQGSFEHSTFPCRPPASTAD